ncbi:unnamed protein product [Durusdinium trenchii]|uniref:Pentatricopeptide repeat-containing protein, chloroplastic n=1 Tax=Durusdinium trenchii TaxID=1381693 RepID=A0ABP0JKM1_9DINO
MSRWQSLTEIRSCQRLLNSYSESFQWRLALELLRLLGPMGSDGLRADVMILNSVLNVCGKSQRWPEALQLLGDIFLATLKATSVTANTVFGLPTGWATALDWTRDGRRPMDVVGGISLVGRCGWREAQELIRSSLGGSLQVDIVLISAVMNQYQKVAQWRTAVALLEESAGLHLRRSVVSMGSVSASSFWWKALETVERTRAFGMSCSAVTCGGLVSVCHRASAWTEALELLKVSWSPVNAIARNAALSALGGVGAWRRALSGLWQMKATEVSYNAVISACATAGEWLWAFQLLEHRSASSGLGASDVGLNAALNACEKSTCWMQALSLLSSYEASADVISYSSCISSLEKALQWQKALELFLGMEGREITRNVICCNALISACEKSEHWSMALGVCAAMDERHLEMDLISCNASITACGLHWRVGSRLLSLAQRRSLEPSVMTCNVAMSACEKAEQWQQLFVLLDKQLEPNLITYNAVLSGCALRFSSLAWYCAIDVLHQISARRLEANALTYQEALRSAGSPFQGASGRVLLDKLRRFAMQELARDRTPWGQG